MKIRPLQDRIVVKRLESGIRVADDGLLEAGGPGTQLTWMDAKVGDDVVTPRVGKPVEINALWYNALLVGADLADGSSEAGAAARWRAAAERCRGAFNERFWNDDLGCLFDVVDECHEPGRLDASVRPTSLDLQSVKGTAPKSVTTPSAFACCKSCKSCKSFKLTLRFRARSPMNQPVQSNS